MVIPVIIPVNPSTLLIDVNFSVWYSGSSTITCGGVNAEYPKPGLVTVADVITPLVIVAVATALVPIHTPIEGGALIYIDTDPLYPEPPFEISTDEIVPAADTIAVAAAPTFISPDVINASTELNAKL